MLKALTRTVAARAWTQSTVKQAPIAMHLSFTVGTPALNETPLKAMSSSSSGLSVDVSSKPGNADAPHSEPSMLSAYTGQGVSTCPRQQRPPNISDLLHCLLHSRSLQEVPWCRCVRASPSLLQDIIQNLRACFCGLLRLVLLNPESFKEPAVLVRVCVRM